MDEWNEEMDNPLMNLSGLFLSHFPGSLHNCVRAGV